ncbi:MAG: acyl carrier protein [Clostridia bacterium]|nr:acyl carrier protein [Clostridia bacterium]
MERSDIVEKLREILQLALGANADEVLAKCTEESNLTTDLGLNSVGILYVVIGIEEIFSVSFEGVSFGDFKTVGDVVDYIEKYTA